MITNHLNYSFWFRSLLTAILMAGGVMAFAQQSISGTIIDETGEGLPGVTIQEVGTTNGTITDIDGKYSLTVSSGAQISISFVGYTTQIVTVGSQNRIDVSLVTDTKALDEVVVIGYGTQKRSDLTGSIVSVTGDALRKVPVASVAESLTGRLAGVQVTSTEGSPDAQINIRVRGGGSLSQDASPLLIVDGFPVNSISDIAPSDIQSIDVLKDASSTAIYGSRGANGVIIITTKSGNTNGKMTVSLNTFYGERKIANTLDVLSPEDYARWQHEYAVLSSPNGDISSYTNFFGAYSDLDLYEGIKGNDWQKQVYGRVGQVFSTDLSIRGGNNVTNYSANFARFDDKAIMVGSDFVRNNFTFKLNNKPTDKVTIAFSLRYSDTKINGGGANEQNEISSADSRLKNSLGYYPIPIPGLSTNGLDDTDAQSAGDLVHPLVAVSDNDREQLRKNFNLGGSVSWQITDDLTFMSSVNLDNTINNDNRFYGKTTYYSLNRPAEENKGKPAVVLNERRSVRFRNANTLNYDFKNLLNKDHDLKVLAGQEVLKTQNQSFEAEIHGFPTGFSFDQAAKLTTQGDPLSNDNFFSPNDNLLSFFGRVNYEFKGRYLLSATYRADGSSKFLGANQWGYFPSAAVGWKVHEESFMSGTSGWLNTLKLRVSYGQAGNNNIPTGQTFQSFLSNTTTYLNDITSYWSASSVLANPDLKWETTTTRNIGMDYGLFKGKLIGSFEAYLNNTTDLLVQFPVSGTGYTYQYRNIGETENKGLEASLQYYAIETENYGVNFSLNVGMNRNQIISLGTEDYFDVSGWASSDINSDFAVAAGSPLGNMNGYVSDGRYEVSDFDYNSTTGTYTLKAGVVDASFPSTGNTGRAYPGMMKFKDLNDDGVVNLNDRKIIGNALPKHTGGFVLNGYAYGFDLTAAFNWSVGNDVYNANKIEFTSAKGRYRNMLSIQETGKRWTNIDPVTGSQVTEPTQLAALNANTTMWSPYMSRYVFSDWAVEDASFLRLNTLTLGYTLPSELVSKYRISSLRFYTTANNVFVITNYSGFDPEVSTRRKTPFTPGVDYSAYPRSRMLVIGLNATF